MIRLKELRIEKGLKQKEVANSLNLSPQVYCNYETEKRKPTPEMLCTLADYFDVSVDYLIGKSNLYFPDKLSISADSSINSEETKETANILKDLRAEKHVTQKDVALACGVTPTCICQLENGTRTPTGSTIKSLAQYFDVSADYLLGLKDDLESVIYTSPFDLTEKEKNHIVNLRKLPTETQSYIFGLVENLAISG